MERLTNIFRYPLLMLLISACARDEAVPVTAGGREDAVKITAFAPGGANSQFTTGIRIQKQPDY